MEVGEDPTSIIGFVMSKDDIDIKREIDDPPNEQLNIPSMESTPISFYGSERKCEAYSEDLEKKIPKEE